MLPRGRSEHSYMTSLIFVRVVVYLGAGISVHTEKSYQTSSTSCGRMYSRLQNLEILFGSELLRILNIVILPLSS